MGAYATILSMADRYAANYMRVNGRSLWTVEDDYRETMRYGRIMGRSRP